jgi:hypothetical protein
LSSRDAMGSLRGRAVMLRPRPAEDGSSVDLDVVQESRRESKLDQRITVSLDDAKLMLRRWQGAVDEAHRRSRVLHEAIGEVARELQPEVAS